MLLLALIYLFIIAVVAAIRRDLRRAAARDETRVSHLVVVEPGRTGIPSGHGFRLEDETIIGRAGRSTIVLDDAFVSSEHAAVVRKNGSWWLVDRGSTNGTLLNGEPIQGEAHLSTGDVIGIGEVTLEVRA